MFVALRDLRFARGRFALMGAVVALVAVLGVILSGLATGLASSGISSLRAIPVTHFAFEKSAAGELFSRSTVDLAAVDAWRGKPGVKAAAPFGNTLVHAQVTKGTTPTQQLDLAVFGVEPGSFVAPKPLSGARLGSVADGILISKEIAGLGIKVGDVLTVDRVGTALTVVGTIGSSSYGHVGVVYAPLITWQRLRYGLPGALPASARTQATAVALQLGSGADLATLDAAASTHTVTKSASYSASPGYTAESSTMTLIRGFLYVISALVVGAFFTVWTIQRKPEIALLKALGGSTRYILRDALGQVLAVLLIATTVGTAIGLLLGRAMSGAAPFSLQPSDVLTSSALLVLLGALGALVAVRRVTGVDPVTALGANR